MLKKLVSKVLKGANGHRPAGTPPTHGTATHGHQSPKAAAAKTAVREVSKAMKKR